MECRGGEKELQEWPLTDNQSGIYYVQHLDPNSRAFNIAYILSLKTDKHSKLLEPDSIQTALKNLVSRHTILRSTITLSHLSDKNAAETSPMMKFGATEDFVIATVVTNTTNLSRALIEEIRKPYDFTSQLFRFTCFQVSRRELTLFLGFHHIIADGSSLHTLTLEFLSLLSGDVLPPDPPQFTAILPKPSNTVSSDITPNSESMLTKKQEVITKWAESIGPAQQCTSFKHKYPVGGQPENSPGGHFKECDPRGPLTEHSSEWVALSGEAFLTHAIRVFSEYYNMSPTVIITAAYITTLNLFLNPKSNDIVIGCAFMNRSRSLQGMVGHTVSLLPLRVDFSSSSSSDLSSIVAQVHRAWCLILEGRITLLDLLPLLPCLGGAPSQVPTSTHSPPPTAHTSTSIRAASPLQAIFSFHSMSQNHFPSDISLPDGSKVQCSVDLPRSCDSHVDLFLEVRPPRSWLGEGSEVSYLFTWEYRLCALSRDDISKLQNLMTRFLLTSLAVLPNRKRPGASNPRLEQLFTAVDTDRSESYVLVQHAASSYSISTSAAAAAMPSSEHRGGDGRMEGGERREEAWVGGDTLPAICLWVTQSMQQHITTSDATLKSSEVTYPKPHLLRSLAQHSIMEGFLLNEKNIESQTSTSSSLPPPPPKSYIERFFQKASSIPDQLAFSHSTGDLTYSQTLSAVERLASLIVEKGVCPGDHVTVLMTRTPVLYISLLAVLRCGAAYIPIAINNPSVRILKNMKLAESKLLLTEQAILAEKLPNYKHSQLCINTCDDILTKSNERERDGNKSAILLPPLESSGEIAFIIFTSGTTGEPKGVAITNSSLSLTLDNFQMLLTPQDMLRTLTGCTVAWDGHTLDSLGPLLNGACLKVEENSLYIGEGITYTFMSPSAASIVDFPSTMRALMVGGEAITEACCKSVRNVPKVLSAYGPTETTVFVSSERIDHISETSKILSNLGKPLPHVQLKICDNNLLTLPVGTEGELCITGPLVSSVGYYKNPEKTKSVFIESSLDSHSRMYRTGDRARMEADGRIVFLGRIDDQVKLRGMRFQLLEVETILAAHPRVKTVSAVVRNQGTHSAQLVCFLTPKSVDVQSVIEYAQRTLPPHMVPSIVVTIETMPLKTEGKVDRRALLHRLPSLIQGSVCNTMQGNSVHMERPISDVISGGCGQEILIGDVEEGPTDVVKQLASLFGEVLGAVGFPPDGNFFAHGGHSLLLFQLLQRVRGMFKCCLSLAELLQHPSPTSLARVLENKHTNQPKATPTTSMKTTPITVQEATPTNLAEATPTYIPDTIPVSSSVEVQRGLNIGETLIHNRDKSGIKFDYLAPVPQQPLSPDLVAKLQQLINNDHMSSSNRSTTCVQDHTSLEGGRLSEAEEISHSLFTETGYHFPASSLLQYPDLTTLHTHLKLKSLLSFLSSADSPVVPLLPPTHSHEKPLIFLHGGVIGWALPYIKLARSLKQYSIAIQRTKSSPTSSFEAMASYYIEAIRSVQPCGPYSIIGVCYGAMLLYEVSKQFSDAGETVKLAVFINHSPAIEKLPNIFDANGEAVPGTFAHPMVFLSTILNIPELGCVGLEKEEEEEDEERKKEEGEGGKKEEEEEGEEEVTRNQTEEIDKEKTKDYDGSQKEENKYIRKDQMESEIKSAVSAIFSSSSSSWIPFTRDELEETYLGFFERLRCAWLHYSPQPGANIERCILIRDREHVLFESLDFSLRRLLAPPTSCLTVLTAPMAMGLLSDAETMEFVRASIALYLN